MNKVILMGNLTRDPEVKFLQSGTAVANFGLAMNERWNDQQTGERKEQVTFVEVEAWNKQAEVIGEYFTKGSQMLMEGSLKFEQWQGDDGVNRNRLKVRLQRFEFVGARTDENGNNNRNANSNREETPQTAAPAPTTGTANLGDDIPF